MASALHRGSSLNACTENYSHTPVMPVNLTKEYINYFLGEFKAKLNNFCLLYILCTGFIMFFIANNNDNNVFERIPIP